MGTESGQGAGPREALYGAGMHASHQRPAPLGVWEERALAERLCTLMSGDGDWTWQGRMFCAIGTRVLCSCRHPGLLVNGLLQRSRHLPLL